MRKFKFNVYWKLFLLNITIATFIFPYSSMGWWKFAIATFFILLFFRSTFPDTFLKILGLQIKKNMGIKILLLWAVVAIISELLIRIAINDSSIVRTPGPLLSTWFLQPTFQAGNEEMIFRAAAFFFLLRYIKNSVNASLLLAAIFVALHAAFYWVTESTILSSITLLSLFFATLAMNHVFLRFKHIGYTLAVHAGWNYQKFGATYINHQGQPLLDSEKFNLLEGSPVVLMAALSLFFLTLLSSATHKKTPMTN